jgi:8-oxo-dGTP pyrophosphatase MutT (NUDIX family)
MADTEHRQIALGDNAARQLANATKTTAQLVTISPRWLVYLLQWVPVEAGIYRLNKVKNPQDVKVACAKREFNEETGLVAEGPLTTLTPLRQRSGKMVHAFALEGDFDITAFSSNTFELEWPPKLNAACMYS